MMSSEPSIEYSADLADGSERGFRSLYLRRKPFYPFLYGLFAIVLIYLGLASRASRGSGDSWVFWSLAAFVLAIAFGAPPMAWRWWWPTLMRRVGGRYSGTIDDRGIRGDTFPRLQWSSVLAAKMCGAMVLIYENKMKAYPFHREMFGTDQAWRSFVRRVRSSVRFVHEFQET